MTEKHIKCLFLKNLIETKKDLQFASIEVSIVGGKRKIDILSLEGNNIVGYEIKSAKDNLTKLEGQIQDYLKVCDRVYVILDQSFSNSFLNLPSKVGIFFFDPQKKRFSLQKKAKKNIPLAYYQSLFVAKDKLRQYGKNGKKNSFEIRHSLIRALNKTDFKKTIVNELKSRFLKNFLLLKNEFERNSNIIHPDDLLLLSMNSCVIKI